MQTIDKKSRSPYGERGLKLLLGIIARDKLLSLSLRRAWIEIRIDVLDQRLHAVALLTESVD